jgi:hypothetical protein
MYTIAHLSPQTRSEISGRSKARARSFFSMEAMALHLQSELERAFAMDYVTTWRHRHKKVIFDNFLLALGIYITTNLITAFYLSIWAWILLFWVYGLYAAALFI